jgi:hypothetical protein
MPSSAVLSRRAAAVLLFAVLLFAILLTARNEPLASQSPKARSSAQLAQAVAQELSAAQLRKRTREIALADPMHAVGFFLQVMALDEEKALSIDARRKLIAEATMRQPAFDAPRIWLAADDVRRGRFAEAINGADTVMRLNSDYRELLLSVLVPLIDEEKAYPLLEKKLRSFPIWRTEFIAAALKAGGPDPRIERLLRHVPPADKASASAAERSVYLKKLVEIGDTAAAHRLWQGFVPDAKKSAIYDGDFSVAHPVDPFAWTFATDDYSYAEKVISAENGKALVRAHHGGDRRIGLLTQLVALRPGSRLLSFTMRDGGLGKTDNLFWRVRCAGAADNLASRSLAKLAANWQKVQMRVEIPESGCAFQYLILEADDNDGEESEVEIRLAEAS